MPLRTAPRPRRTARPRRPRFPPTHNSLASAAPQRARGLNPDRICARSGTRARSGDPRRYRRLVRRRGPDATRTCARLGIPNRAQIRTAEPSTRRTRPATIQPQHHAQQGNGRDPHGTAKNRRTGWQPQGTLPPAKAESLIRVSRRLTEWSIGSHSARDHPKLG